MLSTYYQVSITEIVGTGNAAGFIDPIRVEDYMASNGGTPPATLTTSTDKVRANVRFKNVVEKLQMMGNVYIQNAVSANATVDTPPTTLTFILESERGDEIFSTVDETNTAVTLTGANAITRAIARGMMESRVNYVYPVYDPTPTYAPNGPGSANAISRVSSVTIPFTVDALTNSITTASAAISVTQIVFPQTFDKYY